jgi:glycosyltransferase involved in cell wall biosynthesis
MPHKNLTRLVEAFALAANHGPGKLVIRGWGRPATSTGSASASPRSASGHGWTGSQTPRLRLPRLYRGARMLLLPSFYEGFGLTALEAMACGTPVITSNTSSLPEVVGDAALLVDPLDTAAIADAIARLFADGRLGNELRERGLARARLFSWEKTGRAVQVAIRQAAESA